MIYSIELPKHLRSADNTFLFMCTCVLGLTFHSLLNLLRHYHCVVRVTGVQLKFKLAQMR